MPTSSQGGIAVPLQAMAVVCQEDLGTGVADGVHAFSWTTSGSIVSDRTQGTPLQSWPAGMAP
jgi:hypothetical protein